LKEVLMTPLSTTAWVLHDLGLATSVGSTVFGKYALDPAVKEIGDRRERGRVLGRAWGRQKIFNSVSLGTMALTWFVGRMLRSGREVSSVARGLTIAKDVMVVAAVASGAATAVLGTLLDREIQRTGAPSEPGPNPPPRVARLQRAVSILSDINLAIGIGLIATTAILAMESGKSARWSFFSRRLP
jgi:hypothetical protein